jgi:uncharacterized membrane protein
MENQRDPQPYNPLNTKMYKAIIVITYIAFVLWLASRRSSLSALFLLIPAPFVIFRLLKS